MNRIERVLVALLVLAVMLGAAGCTKLKARDQLNKGVQSYKSQKYEDAINHFQKAIELDPSLVNAKLYLATAYANLYVPGSEMKENIEKGEKAIEEFKNVLKDDPKNIGSIKGIASLLFNMKRMDEAKEYHRKAIAADANDPENYYSVGVIDWTQTYAPRQEMRSKIAGLKPADSLTDKKVCAALKEKNADKVEDGIAVLKKALELRPDYDDAMAYLNLMYRERADYECDDKDARAADLKAADEWVDRNLATKKAKAEKAGQANGIVQEEAKPEEKK